MRLSRKSARGDARAIQDRPSLPRARSLEAGKPKGAFAAATWLIPRPAEVLRLVHESLKGRPLFARDEEKPREGHGVREDVRHQARSKASKGRTP